MAKYAFLMFYPTKAKQGADITMHVKGLLHKLFKDAATKIDKRIHRTLLLASLTLAEHKKLSVTALGRSLKSTALVKHNIKRMDRLFGNKTLQRFSFIYYQAMSENIMASTNNRIVILVDWSGLTHCGQYHFLRASVPVGGRALTMLDMVFHEKDYNSQHAHAKFIKQLKQLIPETCKPIVITDAGFRCPWFKLIKKQGWDFLGRARNATRYLETARNKWLPVKSLYEQARRSANYLFSSLLAKSNSVECSFYLYKEQKKHRVNKNLRGKKVRCSSSKKHEKREREPWLIVTSLSPDNYTPTQIVCFYKKRMQIEEAFRDIKNPNNGLSLRQMRTFKPERLSVLLLVGNMAFLLLWLLGLIVKSKKMHARLSV